MILFLFTFTKIPTKSKNHNTAYPTGKNQASYMEDLGRLVACRELKAVGKMGTLL